MSRPVSLAVLLLLGTGPGCSAPAPAPAPTPPPAATARSSARTAWVHPRAPHGLPLTEAPAHVLPHPEGAAALGLPFRGNVARIAVRPGQRVRKGEVLVELLMPEVVRAAGDYEAATLRREAWQRRATQLEALQAQGMARVFELTEAQAQLAEARAQQQSARALLKAAGVEGAEAAGVAQRGTVPLRSPVEGLVTAVDAVLGESRETGSAPLVRISGEGPARIEARLSRAFPAEASLEFLVPGQAPLPVRLVDRAPSVDGRDGTTAAWFEPEPARALPSGLQGTVRVGADGLPRVKVVPARALVLEGDVVSVLVREGEGYRRERVRVLGQSGADALVDGALAETDEVAADAARLLPAGVGEGS
ncbi:efflux RND transporter periplasmic adaptor subunit [Archangium primigenium]|uniref:efflux RND transporter periplasmic adaptor subunit n=1 Tax=[Archangium] primigenium TaxID=2792470 RepID=UPI00195843E5|nr:efflux RND transporter periplasmic adaptor subunit [Archangium primigenium]MBM7117369.1 efflux RND transporter periplasmic adaptor subunit [Archangium primigenium]